MSKKLISLNLSDGDLELLDALVEISKTKSFTPSKVNRSTVIRDLLVNAMREIKKSEHQSN